MDTLERFTPYALAALRNLAALLALKVLRPAQSTGEEHRTIA